MAADTRICANPLPKEEKEEPGILRRIWIWSRKNKVVLILLAIILVQQLILTRMAFSLYDAHKMASDVYFHFLKETVDLKMENAELKEEIKRLKQGAPGK